MADISLFKPNYRFIPLERKTLKNASIIFCDSRHLQEFFDHNSKSVSARIIIAGNSDEEFHEIPKNIPKSVRALFLQNSFISDNKKIFTLPIGVENFRWGVNGNPKYLKFNPESNSKVNKVLFGPFGNTHSERNSVSSEFSNSSIYWEYLSGRMSPKDYSKIASKFIWTAAVRGNGVDTHRLWEALYRGSLPILKEDDWSNSLKILKLPLVFCKNWSKAEISNIVLENKFSSFEPKKLDPLWAYYWKETFRKFL
jgi:hypothetical protein